MYCIYLHRNKINNKVYIGQTKYGDNPNKRWAYGQGYKQNAQFYSDIVTYGWDNFTHEILANDLTLEQANELEKEYIKQYHATNPEFGYNQSIGGNNCEKIADRNGYYDFLLPKQKTINVVTTWYNDAKGVLRRKVTLI